MPESIPTDTRVQEIEFLPANSRSPVRHGLQPDQRAFIGSDAGDDVRLLQEGVEQRHACLTWKQDQVHIAAVNKKPVSVNGRNIIANTPLKDGDWVVLGTALFNIRLTAPEEQPSARPPGVTTIPFDAESKALQVGRMPGSDILIESPIVSSRHAKIAFRNNQWFIEDLGSTNGTYVNGRRINTPVALKPGDQIAIAVFTYAFNGTELQPVSDSGKIRIEVRDLYKEVTDRATNRPKRLLDRINLVFEPGEFVAIFGTSGSGKSTLMDALNGRRPPSGGEVLFNNTSLYGAFDLFRATIGYVPQQDIVHRKITIRNALKYTARLRLPPDTSAREIDEYIEKVLDQVGLKEKADLPVDTPVPLSGGQLKRVSLAVELVANPNLLFLDEVTSGLDAGTDKRMMHLFAELGSGGKTVICVTHTLESIDACDLVVLLHQGQLVYFGPPGDAAGYFGIRRLSDVYELLESSNPGEWARRFQESETCRRYVSDRMTPTGDSRDPGPADGGHTRPLGARLSPWRQTATLMNRYRDLILSDRRNLLITLLQAPMIGAVICGVFSIQGNIQQKALAESRILFILVLSAIWFGCLNSARELVKELPVYLRERSVNLSIPPYLASKLIPQALICAVQCVMLLAIVRYGLPVSGEFAPQFGVLFAAAMAATAMGLTVSAFVDSNDKAIAIVPILLIPQVILSNAVVRLENSGELFAKFTMISYWSYDALKATLGEASRQAAGIDGEFLLPVAGDYSGDMARIAGFFALFLLTAIIGLVLKDRKS